MPFELDPLCPKAGADLYEKLPKQQVDNSIIYLNRLGKDLGLVYNNRNGKYNSHRAHLAGYYAMDRELYEPYARQVFTAYFTHNQNIAEKEVLDNIVSELGLDVEEMNRLIDSGIYDNRFRNDIKEGKTNGVTSVPTFVINEKTRFYGVRPYDQFKALFVTE